GPPTSLTPTDATTRVAPLESPVAPLLKVLAVDAYGDRVEGLPVTFDVLPNVPHGPMFGGPATVQVETDVAGLAQAPTLQTNQTAGNFQVTAAPPGGRPTASFAVVVQAGSVVRFRVEGFPSPVAAGTAGTFTVTPLDRFGNPVSGYSGTVAFTSND